MDFTKVTFETVESGDHSITSRQFEPQHVALALAIAIQDHHGAMALEHLARAIGKLDEVYDCFDDEMPEERELLIAARGLILKIDKRRDSLYPINPTVK